MKHTWIRLLGLAMVFAMAFSMMVGCGGSNDTTDTSTDTSSDTEQNNNTASTGETKDSIVIATANEPPTLHPYLHSAVAATYMNYLTHDYFLRTNVETLEPEPGVITSWENPSDTEWIFTIRDDVYFHNGDKLTAEDMVASMEYARENEAYTSNYSQFWESVEVLSETQFKVTTKTVYAKTLYDMSSHKILSKKLIEEGNDFNANPIGTGPYKFVEWKLGDSITFVANEEYWDGAPAIKNMTWRIIPEGSSRTIALEAGEIDAIIEVETNDLARLEEDSNVQIVEKPGTSFSWLILNNEKAPFDNQDFRHFMNCAIEKDALVAVALNGAGTGNYTQTPVVFAGGAATEIPDSYDLEKAQEYLDKSGIDPKTVVFSCICSDDVKRRCGEVIQANLAEFGVTMNLESMDLATYLSTASEGNFEACIGGYTTSNMMNFMEGKFTSGMIGGSNWTRTNDPKIDELYTKATKILDDEERNAVLTELANYVNEICPQVPTYGANVTRAYNSDLQGIKLSATGTLYWQYVSWGE